MKNAILYLTFINVVGKWLVFGLSESEPFLECGMEETMEEELAKMGKA